MNEMLLCPPTQLEEASNRINKKKAIKEYKDLTQTYQSLGVIIREIPTGQRSPDTIFTSKLGFSIDTTFIPANPRQEQHKKRADIAKNYFAASGFTVAELPADIAWEGQADLLKAGDIFVLGHGQGTDKQAKNLLAAYMGEKEEHIIDLKLANPKFPTLDTALAPLDRETVLVNPHAFDTAGMDKIKSTFSDVIPTSDHDNEIMGCNLAVINNGHTTKTIVKTQGISDELKHEFYTRGFMLRDIPTTELRKAGGSVKSLSLALYRSVPRTKVTTA